MEPGQERARGGVYNHAARGRGGEVGVGEGVHIELSMAALDEDAPLPGKKKDEKAKKPEQKKKERESPDFTIELVTSDGTTASAPVSRFAAIPPPLKEKFTKLDALETAAYEKDWEPVLQTVRAPLAGVSGHSIRPKLTAVRLKFDRTAMSVICISGIGFGQEEQ
jgi:hypothetical protein